MFVWTVKGVIDDIVIVLFVVSIMTILIGSLIKSTKEKWNQRKKKKKK